jgi:hypothetical protein
MAWANETFFDQDNMEWREEGGTIEPRGPLLAAKHGLLLSAGGGGT